MSDKVISWLRTVVPALWALLVTYLVTRIPALSGIADGLNGVGLSILVPVAVAVWKLVFNAAENALPSWLSAVLLGHPAVPVYMRTTPAPSMIAE
jgi:chromate transport protein ChrA